MIHYVQSYKGHIGSIYLAVRDTYDIHWNLPVDRIMVKLNFYIRHSTRLIIIKFKYKYIL